MLARWEEYGRGYASRVVVRLANMNAPLDKGHAFHGSLLNSLSGNRPKAQPMTTQQHVESDRSVTTTLNMLV